MNQQIIQLNKRQDKILALLENNDYLTISEIISKLKDIFGEVAKITINRDLKTLISLNLITTTGKARGVKYLLASYYKLIRPINVENYFKVEADKRQLKERFDFDIFNILKNIFTENEIKKINLLKTEYQNNKKIISEVIYKKEMERLTIELSWKSSQIEGNTYSLLETEALIKEHREAKGHSKLESTMILNHKVALDYIIKNKTEFKKISVAKIENIHYLLTKNLNISKDLRKTPVGITGTKYRPIDNQWQIKEAMEKMCKLVNEEKDVFIKAIIISILIAYIQPFEDGNKRTSRLISNALLLSNNICPLSYRGVDEVEYKKAVILFYEQNNINYFKQLFIEQFEFAVKNYFRT